MHDEVMEQTRGLYNVEGVKKGYIVFLILTGLCMMVVNLVLNLFTFIPVLGGIVVFVGGFILSSMYAVFIEVSTFKAFRENMAPTLSESFNNEFKESNNDFVKWVILPFLLNLLIGVIAFLSVLLPAILFGVGAYIESPVLAVLGLLLLIIVSVLVNLYLAAAFNYTFFFLADERFKDLGVTEIISKARTSMKGHEVFYIVTVLKKSIPIIVASIIMMIFGTYAIFNSMATYNPYLDNLGVDYSMVIAGIVMFVGVIFCFIYSLFYVVPFIKIFSFSLFNVNFREEV